MTDRQTERRTDRHSYSKASASICCAVKNLLILFLTIMTSLFISKFLSCISGNQGCPERDVEGKFPCPWATLLVVDFNARRLATSDWLIVTGAPRPEHPRQWSEDTSSRDPGCRRSRRRATSAWNINLARDRVRASLFHSVNACETHEWLWIRIPLWNDFFDQLCDTAGNISHHQWHQAVCHVAMILA